MSDSKHSHSCTYCGLPLKSWVRPREDEAVYCCSGCYWADRLTAGAANTPAMRERMIPIIAAFFLFNQFFFLLFGWGFSREIDPSYFWIFVLVADLCGMGLLLFLSILSLRGMGKSWLRSGQGCFFLISVLTLFGFCLFTMNLWNGLLAILLSWGAFLSFYWRAIKRNLQSESDESR